MPPRNIRLEEIAPKKQVASPEVTQAAVSADELHELRVLLDAERSRIRQSLVDASLGSEEYRAAFRRFLEMLPEGSPLKIDRSRSPGAHH